MSGPELDRLAEALGRARAAHERRPDDVRLELRFMEARIAFLDAQLRAEQEERRRAAAAVTTLRRQLAGMAVTIKARIAAACGERKRETRRARRTRDAGAPLLERAG